MRFAAIVLACATSVLGYSISQPNPSQGWTDNGPQRVVWSRAADDRENVTVVLTNPNRGLMPTDQVLVALLDGSLGNTTVNPPSAGWPSAGEGYVLQFVANATTLNDVLAKSPAFEIEHDETEPTSTRTTPITTPTTGPGSGTDKSAPVDDTLGNGALSKFGVPVALAALAGLVPALLA
jgi:hypothetical protein